MIVDPSTSVPAFSTVAAITKGHEIVTAVRVALRAVSLACILGREIITAQNIHGIRDWLHMIGVLTSPIATEVIDSQAVRDGADQQRVEQSMCPKISVVDTELAITIAIKAPCVEPAAIGLWSNPGQESCSGLSIHPFSLAQIGE